jgi:hypothetical protein
MGKNYAGAPADLADPWANLRQAVKMIQDFSKTFSLDVTQDFTALFTCWNAGAPTHKTYDPNYAQNGVARMAIYRALGPTVTDVELSG